MTDQTKKPTLSVHCDWCRTWQSEIPIPPHVTMQNLRWMKIHLDLRFEWHWWRVHFRESFRKTS